MLSDRQQKIIALLHQYPQGLTSRELAQHTGVSGRTIRKDIKNLAEELISKGASIQSDRQKGYQLFLQDEDTFAVFLQAGAAQRMSSQTLAQGILQHFLQAALNGMVLTQQEMADALYVSLTALKSSMKETAHLLGKYGLQLVTYRHDGMHIEGAEDQLRNCLIAYHGLLALPYPAELSDEGSGLHDILFKVIREYHLPLADVAVQDLLLQLRIALIRAVTGHAIVYTVRQSRRLMEAREYEAAAAFFEEVYRVYGLDVPGDEVCYLAQHLLASKKYLAGDDAAFGEAKVLVRAMLAEIKNQADIDLTADEELVQLLSIHMKSAVPRMKFQMPIANEVLDVIKTEYSLAFQLAIIAGDYLARQEKINVNENELGFIAIHFGAALSRLGLKSDVALKHALIVCASGMGTAVLLNTKLEESFHGRISVVGIVPGYKLTASLLDEVDIIVTSVPLPDCPQEKVFLTKHLLNEQEVQALDQRFFSKRPGLLPIIQAFFQRDCFFTEGGCRTKEECIAYLADVLVEKGLLTVEAKASAFEREVASTTEIGNLVAIPHPIYNDPPRSAIAVMLLKKPIIWQDHHVQLVFFLSIARSQFKLWEPIFLKLFQYLVKNNGVKEILRDVDYDKFIQNLERQFA